MDIKRRTLFIAVTLIVVFGVSLTAMRVSESYDPVFSSCGASSDIVIVGGTDTSVNHQEQQLINQWNHRARGHNPEARFVAIPGDTDLVHSQLMAAGQSGSCGYDVLQLDVISTAEFASNELIREIPSGDIENQSGFIPSVLQTGKWNGKQYAIPYTSDVGLLYYKAGTTPPRTWDELVNQGYAGQFENYEGLTVNALEAIWNDGGPDVLTGTSSNITPATVKTNVLPALGKLASAVRENDALRASTKYQELDSQNAFADAIAKDQAALLRDWPSAYRPLAADPRQWNGGTLAFGVEPLPGGYGALGGRNLAISTASRHPMNQVVDFINFMTSEESEKKLFGCAGVAPTRWVVLDSAPECEGDANGAASDASVGPALSTAQITQFAGQLSTALNQALPRPVTPYYTAFSATFRNCVEQVFQGTPPTPEKFAAVVNAALSGQGTRSCGT